MTRVKILLEGVYYEACDYGIELPAIVCLPVLKSMHLRNVSFSGGDSWNRVFSNCSVLEDFFFNFERGYCKLSVSSPTLERLTLDSSGAYWEDYTVFQIVVDAPNLVYLRYTVSKVDSLKFINTQSLVEADIEISQYRIEITSFKDCGAELMRGISKVQTLGICPGTLNAMKLFAFQIPVLHNMTHLTIHRVRVSGLVNLPYLLEKCESLDTLVFEGLCVCDPVAWKGVVESRISCLRTFKAHQFSGKRHEIEMVKYVLKTARVLELIEVHLGSEGEDPAKITKELLMLPRISGARMDIFF